jgi:NLI interacting factor-like phosphatase
MNSITFVVDKLTPPSTPLHHSRNPTTSTTGSPVRPDSGYFSIYSGENDDKDVASQLEPILRRRLVGDNAGATNAFNEKLSSPMGNEESSNLTMRRIDMVMNAIVNVLWALLYPFAWMYSSLRRLVLKRSPPQHSHLNPTSLQSIPYAFPDVPSPDNIPYRPSSSASSASEASSSGTESDAETDISTLAPTDISEASSMSSAPSLRRSPRLQSVAEKEELLALTRRRTADSLKSPTSPRTPSITSQIPHTSLPITTAKTAVQLIPRPLIPLKPSQKTLVLDLDETLIHSLAKGGKLGSGHMVEVKFDKHAILYFVHKRPFCDLFLRKVHFFISLLIIGFKMVRLCDIYSFCSRICRSRNRLARSRTENLQSSLL